MHESHSTRQTQRRLVHVPRRALPAGHTAVLAAVLAAASLVAAGSLAAAASAAPALAQPDDRGPALAPRADRDPVPAQPADREPALAQPADRDPVPAQRADPALPDTEYRVFVGSEATDRISLVVFGPEGAHVEREFSLSMYPTDADGPHGLAMAPDGSALFVTTGHGRPFGNLWKVDPESGRPTGRVELGLFPASLDVGPDGSLAFAVNFNLHGDMVPSSVSVVDTERMIEVSRLETCTMPHGSRLSPDGRRQYSVCMMDDLLVELDVWRLEVSRHVSLVPGGEQVMEGAPGHNHADAERGRDHDGHVAAGNPSTREPAVCSPTWVQPSADGSSLFVACNRSAELVELDAESLTLVRRLPGAPGIYNLDVTSDGRILVGTNKQDDSVSIFDLASGEEIARIATKRRVVHGVVISPDDRYAFVSVEGIGSEPGTLEVIDLAAARSVAQVDLPQMSAGVAFWR